VFTLGKGAIAIFTHQLSENAMTLHRGMTLSLGVGLLLVGALIAPHASLDAQESKPESREKNARPDAENPFADKIVMIYEKGDPSKAGVGFVIKNAHFTQIKGVQFIVGKCIEERGDALAGFSTSVPFDNVGSIDDYKQFAAKLSRASE
jgi:hypothetical protein